jgi:hypothetical protein
MKKIFMLHLTLAWKRNCVYLLLATVLLAITQFCAAQSPLLPPMKNPKLNKNVCPFANRIINPDSTLRINPLYNHIINPILNYKINPDSNALLDPKRNLVINPHSNYAINPLNTPAIHPFMNENLRFLFEFDGDNSLVGYIVPVNYSVMNCFDLKGNWTGYYILANKVNTYLQFDLNDKWTGVFLCDNLYEGYNQFDKNLAWTKKHCN